MAQHGYLREYDEDRGRGAERDRQDRDADRGRGFMFDDGIRDRFDRMGDRARERFSDDDRQWRATHQDDWNRSRRDFHSRQDDHYRSWRDQQIQALDRDYEDYCREREQQFHSDFNNWRSSRGQGRQQGRSREEILELTESPDETVSEGTPSAVSDATLGTNNSENTAPGRR